MKKLFFALLLSLASTAQASTLSLGITCSEIKTLLRYNRQVLLTDGNMISSRRPGQGAAYVTIATTDTLSCTQAYLWTPQANTWNPPAPSDSYNPPSTPNNPGQYNGGCDFFGVGCGGTGPNGGA